MRYLAALLLALPGCSAPHEKKPVYGVILGECSTIATNADGSPTMVISTDGTVYAVDPTPEDISVSPKPLPRAQMPREACRESDR